MLSSFIPVLHPLLIHTGYHLLHLLKNGRDIDTTYFPKRVGTHWPQEKEVHCNKRDIFPWQLRESIMHVQCHQPLFTTIDQNGIRSLSAFFTLCTSHVGHPKRHHQKTCDSTKLCWTISRLISENVILCIEIACIALHSFQRCSLAREWPKALDLQHVY